MSEDTSVATKDWYAKVSPLYQGLSEVVTTTISSLLKSAGIDFLAVTSRTKSVDSIIEKIQRKSYTSAEELTDICGVRIISYIESDIDRISDLIESIFKIHPDKSGDKSKKLQINEFGYRSVHYICELSDQRLALPELTQYKDLVFEVQVRTVLQHAWAEIEHDRSYKFSGELPSAIKRRLNLLAGTLELVDREFNNLAREVDEHAEKIKAAVHSQELQNVELTSAAITELLTSIPSIVFMDGYTSMSDSLPPSIFTELRQFGINTLEEFSELMSEDFLESYFKHYSSWAGAVSLIRAAMLYKDIDKFLAILKGEKTRGVSFSLWKLLDDRYGIDKVNAALKENNFKRSPGDTAKRVKRNPPPSE